MKREELIFEIVKIEWDMFQRVHNTGGRASCQDDPDTFFRMRMSQWAVYSDDLLKSYRKDLEDAWNEGRNFLFEKYGGMMKNTFPEEYEEIRDILPAVSDHARAVIDELAAIHVEWDREFAQKYPHIRENGRLFNSRDDSAWGGVSSKTYFREEAATYSERTLEFLEKEMKEAKKNGENLLSDMIACEVAFYGYKSLDDAEKTLLDS